jgi:undecaprenyl-diphosphatase
MNFEIKIVTYLNSVGNKRLDCFLSFINSITFLAFFWVVLSVIAIMRHPEITGSFLKAIVMVAVLHFGITEGIIKHLALYVIPKRKRPFVAYPLLIKSVGRKFSDSSFPSSHMASSTAMLFVITAFYPSLLILAIFFVVLMAFSRLHNGMHYPSDILAGVLLGLGYGGMTMYALKFLF